MENVHFSAAKLQGGFWGHYEDLVRRVTVPAVYDRFAETGRFAALQCDAAIESHIYWDSDIAKWIEAVAYLCESRREPELEKLVDDAVAQMEAHQLPNGYFNSYYIAQAKEKIFTNRDNHELYCAGHLLEAAIAYDQATGKHAFLNMMLRYADYIYNVFYEEKSAGYFTPGHEEIELALLKLAEYTGNEKYLRLAAYFLEERGKHALEVCVDPAAAAGPKGTYYRWLTQSVQPVREMTFAYGHAVRAGYLYIAMADLARQTRDRELLAVCKGLFRDILDTKLSITGGVGAQLWGEAFGLPYRLSNRENYNETCAAISLAMFAAQLQRQEVNSEYADVIERVLYNGILSGMSLEGDAFFYENALEIDLRDYDLSTRSFAPMDAGECHQRGLLHNRRLQRAKVFTCSCCPPNIARTLASVTQYLYTVDEDTIYCQQFAASRAELTVKGQPAAIEQVTNYPADGKLSFFYHGPDACLAVRIPGWCREYSGKTQQGYAKFPVTDGAVVELELPMHIHFVEANPEVCECAGKVAVTRGPIVYCLEGVDNGKRLWDITLLGDGAKVFSSADFCGIPALEIAAFRRPVGAALYRCKSDAREYFTARLIPYFAFANRGISDMQIWTRM